MVNIHKKSSTCFRKGKQQRPLTEYDSYDDALVGAAFANHRYGSELVPFRCQTCSLWHLRPERKTKSKQPLTEIYCDCRGSDDCPKEAYKSRKEAKNIAKQSRRDKGVTLRVYKCKVSDVWHLTHTKKDVCPIKKSCTCFARDGKQLTEYRSYEAAMDGAGHWNSKKEKDQVPYQCFTCNYWHLTYRHQQSTCGHCNCTNMDGSQKDIYRCRSHAEQKARKIFIGSGVRLNVYKCHSGDVWHLSSNRKSNTCFDRSGRQKTEYFSYEDADHEAELTFRRDGEICEPYRCTACYKWHLRPGTPLFQR